MRTTPHFGLLRVCIQAAFALLVTTAINVANANDDADTLIKRGARWKYFIGPTSPPVDWKLGKFDDSKWKTGKAGFGYGDGDDQTILKEMAGRYTAVHIRQFFEVADPDEIKRLFLYINFDDGFIAYLNGTKVASAFAARQDGQLVVDLHEANGYEQFELTDATQLLRPGQNLLAIEGHNASVDSSDFSLDPILRSAEFKSSPSRFTAADFLADLDEFEERLLDQSSYLTRRSFDYEQALAELRRSIDDETDLVDFTVALQKLVMQIGDCHAGVYGRVQYPIDGFLPFRIADTADGIAALRLGLNKRLDDQHPYIDSLDGISLDRWLRVASQFAPHGSPQLRRRRALEWLILFDMWRDELGVKRSPIVNVSLRSANGKEKVERRMRLTKQQFSVATINPVASRRLDNNIGYIRIPSMDDRMIESVVSLIKRFRDTEGIIIDVRENPGGTYGILRAIYPFFCTADAEPYITNIAAYRLSSTFSDDHIAYRPTFRADSDHWNDAERAAIRKAAAAFAPEWTPPEGQFSQWHYMVLNRRQSGRPRGLAGLLGREPKDYFHYDKPVVVLSSAGSFSATDGFLSAFADLPQVTIIGEASGGGSGATRRFLLPRTQTMVALSSMASFRANGKTFDGNGIEVDIKAKPTLEDFLSDRDSVRERAVAVIGKRQK